MARPGLPAAGTPDLPSTHQLPVPATNTASRRGPPGSALPAGQRGQRGEERSRRFMVQNEALRGGEQRAGGDYGHPGPVDRAEDGREQLRYAPALLRAGRQVAAESELGDDLRDPLIRHADHAAVGPGPYQERRQQVPRWPARAAVPAPSTRCPPAARSRCGNQIGSRPPPRPRDAVGGRSGTRAVRPDPTRPPRAVRSAPGSARGPACSRCGVHGGLRGAERLA